METEGVNQWSSTIVPSVQEMVKEKMITTVPPRYIRSDQDKIEVAEDSGTDTEIPIIDMKRLCSSTDIDSEVEKLDFACKEWGFFQLVNHGMESSFLDKFKSEVQDFFNLPMEEKKKFWQKENDLEGFGQFFVLSEDQKLDWADMFYIKMQPLRLRKPHLFPKLPLPLRDTLESYLAQVNNITKIILEKMARALKIEPEEKKELFGDEMGQSTRMNYYPPCPEPDRVIGFSPHSDGNGLTVLMQVNEVGGLQIKKDNKWIPIKPLPNAFIVNLGDIIEMITNGIYQSMEHRVVVNSGKERMSIATFNSPGPSKEFGPIRSLVEKQKVAKFRRVSYEEYFEGYFSREINGKSYLDTMRI